MLDQIEIKTYSMNTIDGSVLAEIDLFFESNRHQPNRKNIKMKDNYDPVNPHSAQSLLRNKKLSGFTIARERGVISCFSGFYNIPEKHVVVGGVRLYTSSVYTRYLPPLMLADQANHVKPASLVMTINLSNKQLYDIVKRLSTMKPDTLNEVKNQCIKFYSSCTFFDHPIMFNNTLQLVLATDKIDLGDLDGFRRS